MVSDRFRLRYRLTPEHFQSYSRMATKRSKRSDTWVRFFGWLVIGALGAGLSALLQKAGFISRESAQLVMVGALLGALATIIFYWFLFKRRSRSMADGRDAMIGDFNLAAYEAGGLQITGQHMQWSFDWTALVDVTQSSEIIAIWVGRTLAVILPVSVFADTQEKDQFVDFVNERIVAHKKQDDFPENE